MKYLSFPTSNFGCYIDGQCIHYMGARRGMGQEQMPPSGNKTLSVKGYFSSYLGVLWGLFPVTKIPASAHDTLCNVCGW